MKKILYIITTSELGGAQVHLSYLINFFHRKLDIHLAVGDLGYLTEQLKELDINVHLINSLQRSINPFVDTTALIDLAKLTKEISPDLIHLHSSKAGVLGKIAGKISKVPTVYSAHGWAFSEGAAFSQKWISLLIELSTTWLASKVICGADSERKLALSYRVASPEKITTIHYGVENTSPNHIFERDRDRIPRVIMMARFSPQKDQKTLIKAMDLLAHLDFELVFVGSGQLLEETQEFAKSTKIANKIKFLGNRTDLDSLFQNSDIFVNSSHYEGLPLCILHAMRCQLPVIATGVSGVPEAVKDDINGYLIPPEDETTMSSRLETLLLDADKRQEFGEKGKEFYLQEFTLELMLRRIEKVYAEFIKAEG